MMVVNRYNWLSKLEGNTLDLGGGSGESQLRSEYNDYFLSENYLNVDINGSSQVKTIQSDILELYLDKKFDNIILFNVLEYFPLRDIPSLRFVINKHLAKDGTVYLTVPYKEKIRKLQTYDKEYSMIQCTYDIDCKLVENLFPEYKITSRQIRRKINWGYDNKPRWWKFARLIKRATRGNFWQYQYLFMTLKNEK